MELKPEKLGTVYIHVCPNGCDALLCTSAHVMQDWAVDAEGSFQECLDSCVQTDQGPDDDNIWTCKECGAEADLIFCTKYSIDRTILYVPKAWVTHPDIVYALHDGLNGPQRCPIVDRTASLGNGIRITLGEDGQITAENISASKPTTTYTAHRYGATHEDILDMTMFDDAADAIKYATKNNCDEVVNDESGDIIYQKAASRDKFILSCCADDGSIVYSMPFDERDSALSAGIYSVIRGEQVSLHIRENTGNRTQQQPARFISLKKIQRLLDEYNNNVDDVVSVLEEE